MLNIKKFLIVLTIILLVNPISFAQIILAEGTLVDESFIEIETSEELATIKDDLTENYVLTTDIDLKDSEWESIDTGEFTGTLIGNDFKIKNMPAKYVEDENLGLFTEVSDVKNIEVEVKFTEEGVAKEETEESKSEEEIVEEETEESQTEEKVVEEETVKKTKQDTFKEVIKETGAKKISELKKDAIIEPKESAEYKKYEVDTYKALKNALNAKEEKRLIILQKDFTIKASRTNQLDIAPGEVIIDGQKKFKLEQPNEGISARSLLKAYTESGKVTKITFRDINLLAFQGNSVITQDGDTDWKVIFDNVNTYTKINDKTEIGIYDGRLVNAANANVEFKNTVNFITRDQRIIEGAKSVTVNDGAKVSLVTKGIVYDTASPGAKLHIMPEGKLFVFGKDDTNSAIILTGSGSKIQVEGLFALDSERRVTGENKDKSEEGLIKLVGGNSEFNVDNGTVDISHAEGSILNMAKGNSSVNISGKNANVEFLVEEGDGEYDAPLHFKKADNYEINVSEGASFKVNKNAGKAPGIRLDSGKDHKINVFDGARFSIHNKGSGPPQDPAGRHPKNQALYFNTKDVSRENLPQFTLDGFGSEVELIADNGVAMHMTNGGNIEALEDTSFIARGKTAKTEIGIIDTGGPDDDQGSKFILTKPAYYDFRNDHPNGGSLFNVSERSEMHGNQTDLALWKKGSNLDERPNQRIPEVTYTLSGEGFKDIIAIDDEGIAGSIENGMMDYSRISGSKATAEHVSINELYQPTDADKKIYAQASIDEGIFGTRDLYEDEAEVEITHKKSGEIGPGEILKGNIQPRNQDQKDDSFKIYGKETLIDKDRGMNGWGWAEIKLPEDTFLEAGDTIEVTGGTLLDQNDTAIDGESILSKNINVDERTVVDVTPPNPTELEEVELTNRDYLQNRPQKLIGSLPTKSEEEQLEVSVEVSHENGDVKNVEGDLNVNRDENQFEYVFKEKLEENDRIRIYLSDNSLVGLDNVLGNEKNLTIPNRPLTHTDKGNINPKTKFKYHDKVFEAAPTLFVVGASGELIFESAPDNLYFDVKVKPYKERYFVNKEKLGQPLAIIDDRPAEIKKGWRLTAEMERPLTAIDDSENILEASLIYRDDGNDKILTDRGYQVVKSHVNEEEETTERWDLSSIWNEEGDGIFIDIEPGALKADYQGQVNWVLEDVPEDGEKNEENN